MDMSMSQSMIGGSYMKQEQRLVPGLTLSGLAKLEQELNVEISLYNMEFESDFEYHYNDDMEKMNSGCYCNYKKPAAE